MASQDRISVDGGVEAEQATLQVPPQHFKRFQDEVLFDLGSAGENLDEACGWAHDEDKPSDVQMESRIRVTAKELPHVHAVEQMWQQVDLVPPTTDTTVTGNLKVLRSTIIGCVLACGGDVAGAAQGADIVGRARPAVAELQFWLDRLEEIGEEPLPEGWFDLREEK